jgi:hypothetical protein
LEDAIFGVRGGNIDIRHACMAGGLPSTGAFGPGPDFQRPCEGGSLLPMVEKLN